MLAGCLPERSTESGFMESHSEVGGESYKCISLNKLSRLFFYYYFLSDRIFQKRQVHMQGVGCNLKLTGVHRAAVTVQFVLNSSLPPVSNVQAHQGKPPMLGEQ